MWVDFPLGIVPTLRKVAFFGMTIVGLSSILDGTALNSGSRIVVESIFSSEKSAEILYQHRLCLFLARLVEGDGLSVRSRAEPERNAVQHCDCRGAVNRILKTGMGQGPETLKSSLPKYAK